jgi:hypothetical protein
VLGWRVERIVIGLGKPAFTFTLRGTPVELAKVPAGGHVDLAPRHLRQVRLRSALIYLAGPGSELLIGLALGLAIGWHTVFSPSVATTVIAVQATLAAIALDALFNLLPMKTTPRDKLVGEGHPNDGLGIIMSFLWPIRVFEQRLDP